jgi:1-acyl-sn-glycerol-3-phosphate acyltransferase
MPVAELVYPPVIGFARTVFAGLGLRFDITGVENIPRTGGAVMASNHIGYLDFTFVGLTARPIKRLVRFMAKEAVFRHKVSGPLMRGMKHIPVDRAAGSASYAAAVQALKDGELVGVFPEATISRSFELKGFKTGAVRMAAEAGVPILPVIVWGSQRLMTKGRPRDFHRGKAISIAVGEPMAVTGDHEADTAELKARMGELLGKVQADYPQRPSGPTDDWWLPARLGGSAPTLEQAEELDRADKAR